MAAMNENPVPPPDPQPEPPRERNPHTERDHKRDVLWQITFPIIVGLSVVLLLAVLTLTAATGNASIKQAADASLIFLIIPLMIVTILFTVIFAGIAYGLLVANQKLPYSFKQAQDFMYLVRDQVRMGSDKVVEPILRVQSFFAQFDAFKKKKEEE
jgi:hypothetical protein